MALSPPKDLPPLLWLWAPPILILLQFAALGVSQEFHDSLFRGELGMVELGTTLIYLPGIVAGLLALRLAARLPAFWLRLWLFLFVLGAIYIAGEEISWGQHLFQWQSPELFQHINKQQETNLHNSTTWLNQKPRILMELWILIGGILVPLHRKITGQRPAASAWSAWLWPTHICLPVALWCFFIKLPVHLHKWLDLPAPLFTRFNLNETHEFYIAVFLTLYLGSIYVRLKQQPANVR